jgi:hypothetical protein
MSLSDRLSRSRGNTQQSKSTPEVEDPSASKATPPAPGLPIWHPPTPTQTIAIEPSEPVPEQAPSPAQIEETSAPPIAEITQVFASEAKTDSGPAPSQPAPVVGAPNNAASTALFDPGDLFRDMGVEPLKPVQAKPVEPLKPVQAKPVEPAPLPRREPTNIKPATIKPAKTPLTEPAAARSTEPAEDKPTEETEAPNSSTELFQPEIGSRSRASVWNRLLTTDEELSSTVTETPDTDSADSIKDETPQQPVEVPTSVSIPTPEEVLGPDWSETPSNIRLFELDRVGQAEEPTPEPAEETPEPAAQIPAEEPTPEPTPPALPSTAIVAEPEGQPAQAFGFIDAPPPLPPVGEPIAAVAVAPSAPVVRDETAEPPPADYRAAVDSMLALEEVEPEPAPAPKGRKARDEFEPLDDDLPEVVVDVDEQTDPDEEEDHRFFTNVDEAHGEDLRQLDSTETRLDKWRERRTRKKSEKSLRRAAAEEEPEPDLCPHCGEVARADIVDGSRGIRHMSCDSCFKMWQETAV